MKVSKWLYHILEILLIEHKHLTQLQSDIICRKGHRKERYWKRHIIDLCEFVLENREIENVYLIELLQKSIVWCKQKGE